MNANDMNSNTSISTYLFGWIAIFFGQFTLDDWAVIIGMIATILGFLITWYYKHQDFKLKKQSLESHGHGKQKKDRK